MKSDLNGSHARSSASWRKQKIGKEGLTQTAGKAFSESHKYRLGGYVRLSPSNEERDEGSLVSHPQRIEQFVTLKNAQQGDQWGEIVEWYVDRELSGKDMNRPAFQRMCRDIANGKINAVIVTELSRLSRNVKDFCEFREFLKSKGAVFFSLKESFDTSTPAGELMVIQCISFAQFERQTIVERIQRGARARAERGLANGVTPLGYDRIDGKKNHRTINKMEKPIVEMIFREFLRLKNIEKLIRFLDDKKYRTKEYVTQDGKKRGGMRWTHGSVYNLLTNRVYIGQREINKRSRSKDSAQLKEEDRYYYVQAQWPAIISIELFNNVQDLLAENKKKARKYTHTFQLTGLVKCGVCGERLVGKSGHGRNGKYYYYGHFRKRTTFDNRHLERCTNENVSAVELEQAVTASLRELAKDRKLVAKLIVTSHQRGHEQLTHKQELINSKEQDRRKNEQEIRNLVAAIAGGQGEIARQVLTQRIEELTIAGKAIESTLILLREDLNQAKSNVIDCSEAFETLRIFREEFDRLAPGKQATHLKNIVHSIVIKPDQTILEVFGSGPDSGFVLKGSLKNSDCTKCTDVAPTISDCTGVAPSRSPVRTVSKVDISEVWSLPKNRISL